MKILVIDTFSYKAHKYFNKLHIDTLVELGNNVDIVGKKGQFDIIEKSDKIKKHDIPKVFYKKYPFPQISSRLIWMICHLWLLVKYNPKRYDAVLMLVYEPMSIFTYRTQKPVMLFTHDGHYLDNKIKLKALKLTPKHYIHIGLSEEITNHLKDLLPDRKVLHVPHGLYKPSYEYVVPAYIKGKEKYLFCPINMKYDQHFVDKILQDRDFHTYLEENNLILFVKKQLLKNTLCQNIIPIENDIPKKEYDYLMENATAVILPYEKEYKYRCSGIMLECVIRDTPVLATRLEAWTYLKDRINIRMFDDAKDIMEGLEYFKLNGLKNVDKSYFSPYPYWKKLLEDCF